MLQKKNRGMENLKPLWEAKEQTAEVVTCEK
jgi:hypothetical protein